MICKILGLVQKKFYKKFQVGKDLKKKFLEKVQCDVPNWKKNYTVLYPNLGYLGIRISDT